MKKEEETERNDAKSVASIDGFMFFCNCKSEIILMQKIREHNRMCFLLQVHSNSENYTGKI